MKEIKANITIQEDDEGQVWLRVPNAAINLWGLKPVVVRRAFLKWAEDEFRKAREKP